MTVAKFKALGTALNNTLICREEEVAVLMLALVAGEHALFIGPPGTGKSALCTSLGKAAGVRAFSVLLTKFSTPDDVFGPVSLSGLKDDRYERVLGNRLADSELAFIDEVFKANPAILNSMLTVMQERKYDNGGKRVAAPLRTLVGASNEWPEAGELDALFDRFLVRCSVMPVPPSERKRLLFNTLPDVTQVLSLADIDQANTDSAQLAISQEAQDCYQEIISTLESEKIVPGDRRMRNALKIARAAAFLDSSPTVERQHLESLKNVLWPRHEVINATHEIVLKLANPAAGELQSLISEATEIISNSNEKQEPGKQLTDIKKLDEILRKAQTLGDTLKNRKFQHTIKIHKARLKAAQLDISFEDCLKTMKLDLEYTGA